MVLLMDDLSATETRRKHERRFQASALTLRLKLFNGKNALPPAQDFEPESSILKEAVVFLESQPVIEASNAPWLQKRREGQA
jgi:hypothetical protein